MAEPGCVLSRWQQSPHRGPSANSGRKHGGTKGELQSRWDFLVTRSCKASGLGGTEAAQGGVHSAIRLVVT